MNLALEKREKVTKEGKGRGEIRREIGKVIRMILQIAWENGMECLVNGRWLLEKWRYFCG